MKTVFSFFISILLLSPLCLGQKQTNIWYFGLNAGLDFNFNPPKTLLNGNLYHFEGNGCLADSTGKLGFYSDGKSIWNKNNNLVKNGSGLYGGVSSTQASLIVSHPKNNGKTIILTSDWGGTDVLAYSIIENDSITLKNKILLTNSSEKLNAVNHQNNNDIWIATHSNTNDTFFFFIIKKKEIIDCPIIQKVSISNTDQYGSQGQIKFSNNGQYLVSNFLFNLTFLSKFNSENGRLSDYFNLSNFNSYASEFSVNNKYVYIGK